MILSTWNVNSIGVRLPHVLSYLSSPEAPDVLCLQELKCEKVQFPFQAFADIGYQAVVVGQKAYNGVAILSKSSHVNVWETFSTEFVDARFLHVEFSWKGKPLHIVNVYVPNGQDVGSEKYAYKLHWFKVLRDHLSYLDLNNKMLALCGDFNVAPDDRDSYDALATRGRILCSVEEREALLKLTSPTLVDVFRQHEKGAGLFSWWDYREGSYQMNKGLRIDHIYATVQLAERCTRVAIRKEERVRERPSDHVPVEAVFDIE